MDRAIGFDEVRWLQELRAKTPRQAVPELIGRLLLARGLVERKTDGLELTHRGRIALAKLA